MQIYTKFANFTELYFSSYYNISQRKFAISLSHDDEYPPFLGGIQFSLTNADN
jgi:hypothetical protein